MSISYSKHEKLPFSKETQSVCNLYFICYEWPSTDLTVSHWNVI